MCTQMISVNDGRPVHGSARWLSVIAGPAGGWGEREECEIATNIDSPIHSWLLI